jgi:hypothetical protein
VRTKTLENGDDLAADVENRAKKEMSWNFPLVVEE